VDGKRYEQKAVVTNDPRSPASLADVRAQVALARKLQDGMRITWDAYQQANALRTAVAATQDTKDAELAKAITTLRAKVDSVGGNAEGGRGFGGFGGRGGRTPPNFFSLNGRFASQLGTHDNGDHAPTEAMLQTYAASCRDLGTTITSWQAIVAKDVPALNALLEKNGRKPVTATAGVAPPKC